MNIRRLSFAVLLLIPIGCTSAGLSPTAVVPTASPPPTPSPAPSAPLVATPDPQPPDALLSVGGGAPSIGELGTYTWLGAGSDAPWLPGTPVKLQAGVTATVSLEPPVAIATWSVREAKPGDRDGTTARGIASGSGPITFTVPAQAGSLAVQVRFAADAGDANYFWALTPG